MSADHAFDHGIERETPSAGSLRASDAERDAALRALTTHFADGRLNHAEFDERADAALAARTQDQLRALFKDLPSPVPGFGMRSAHVEEEPQGAAMHGGPLLILVPVLLLLAIVAALHGAPPFPLFAVAFLLSRRHRRWNRWDRAAPPRL